MLWRGGVSMKRMARFVRDIKCGRLVYPAGTEIEPLYEHEYGEKRPYEKRWFVRMYLWGKPMFCVCGISRSDFEYLDGKE